MFLWEKVTRGNCRKPCAAQYWQFWINPCMKRGQRNHSLRVPRLSWPRVSRGANVLKGIGDRGLLRGHLGIITNPCKVSSLCKPPVNPGKKTLEALQQGSAVLLIQTGMAEGTRCGPGETLNAGGSLMG